MSTRSVIARKTDAGFTGVYHHWDGYPTGVGATLVEAYQGHFKRDISRMMAFLIDEHPQGWSTINGADWTLPAGPRPDDNEVPCAKCGLVQWQHYAQYYREESRQNMLQVILQAMDPKKADEVRAGKTFQLFGHAYQPIELPHGPECYKTEKNVTGITHEDAAACGCEYAYVIEEGSRIMHILSSYRQNGRKMIGMFGSGDPESRWVEIGTIDLDATDALKRLEAVEAAA